MAALSFSRGSAVPKKTTPSSQRANARPRKRSHTWRDCTTGCTVITLGARATIGSMAGCARSRRDCDSRWGTSQVSILPASADRCAGAFHAAARARKFPGQIRGSSARSDERECGSTFRNDEAKRQQARRGARSAARGRARAAQTSGCFPQIPAIAHPARRGRPSETEPLRRKPRA